MSKAPEHPLYINLYTVNHETPLSPGHRLLTSSLNSSRWSYWPNMASHRNIPLVSLIFLRRSLVFPILFFSSVSLHWSLKKAFLSLLAILWNSAFRCLYLSFSPLLFTYLLFTAICKASFCQNGKSHFAFLYFLFHGDDLDPCLLYNVTNFIP